MKKLLLLKSIFDILFFVGILSLFSVSLMMLLYNFGNLTESKDGITHFIFESINWSTPFVLAGSVFYLLIVKKFSKLIRLYFKGQFFSKESSRIYKLIGYFFILSTLLTKIPPKLFLFFGNSAKRIFSFGFPMGFDSFFFLIAIGLFFIALSKIFEMAIELKQENDLTI